MSERKVNFQGVSGKQYTYWIYPLGTQFVDQAGNYSFANDNGQGRIRPTYFGEAQSLKGRLNDAQHEKADCSRRNGANVICTHTNNAGRDARLAEEADLRASYTPPCNDQ